MRVYNKIVIDMETEGVIEAEWTDDYDGPVAECKGGTTSTVTGEVDYAFNARMAEISERQQAMAEEYMDFWRDEYQPLEKAQIDANMELLPGQVENEKKRMDYENVLFEAGKDELTMAKPVMAEYYKQALNGINPDDKVNQARADVASTFKEGEAQMRREGARLGLDPNSAKFQNAMNARGMDQARATAGAMTTTRNAVEDENFRRLSGAASAFKQGLPR